MLQKQFVLKNILERQIFIERPSFKNKVAINQARYQIFRPGLSSGVLGWGSDGRPSIASSVTNG